MFLLLRYFLNPFFRNALSFRAIFYLGIAKVAFDHYIFITQAEPTRYWKENLLVGLWIHTTEKWLKILVWFLLRLCLQRMSGEKGNGEDSTNCLYHFVPWEKGVHTVENENITISYKRKGKHRIEKSRGEHSKNSHFHFVPWGKRCTYKIQ